MTAGMIVGLILLPFAWMLIAAANKAHRDETGVNAPTRDGWRRIRRNARKKGISEAEAYNQWLNRKTSKSRKAYSSIDFIGRDDRSIKPVLSAEDIAQDKADEPLKALAKAQRMSLHRQFNGFYYLLDHGSSQGVMIKNPLRPADTNFTRKEAEVYLTPGASFPPVAVVKSNQEVGIHAANPDEALMTLAIARNWSLHRQTNGKYYILNLNRSPTAYVTNPGNPAKHEFTREEAEQLLATA
ncbi:hypothetical protein J2W51_006082 [Tardiphaga robiniae]|uniref:hypothetical protein n=1 Tax=Tardiphaga robiniae TaxID=943830 RepID=UPI002862F267|nr:hypothetical protein [Tardiphaga robiniae]MDR6663488.1 hypothetical protein [Tardiphaga robiniae]